MISHDFPLVNSAPQGPSKASRLEAAAGEKLGMW